MRFIILFLSCIILASCSSVDEAKQEKVKNYLETTYSFDAKTKKLVNNYKHLKDQPPSQQRTNSLLDISNEMVYVYRDIEDMKVPEIKKAKEHYDIFYERAGTALEVMKKYAGKQDGMDIDFDFNKNSARLSSLTEQMKNKQNELMEDYELELTN